jgi:hypothetical protein
MTTIKINQARERHNVVEYVKIELYGYQLHDTQLEIVYTLLGVFEELVRSGRLILTQEDLADWGTDDKYIEDKVLEKLGYTRYVQIINP